MLPSRLCPMIVCSQGRRRARGDCRQAVVFDTLADDIQSIRLAERCVTVETALGHFRRRRCLSAQRT